MSGKGTSGAQRVERRLAAILAADVAGRSRLMERDEAGTLARLRTLHRGPIAPKIPKHKHRELSFSGLRLAMGEMELGESQTD